MTNDKYAADIVAHMKPFITALREAGDLSACAAALDRAIEDGIAALLPHERVAYDVLMSEGVMPLDALADLEAMREPQPGDEASGAKR